MRYIQINPFDLSEKLMGKVWSRSAFVNNGCLEWQGSLNNFGYGRIWLPSLGKMVYVHRLTATWAYGTLPGDWDVDHLCRNHACILPVDLEPVGRAENLARGLGTGAGSIRSRLESGTCANGHDDWVDVKGGGSACRTCRNERSRDWYYQKRQDPNWVEVYRQKDRDRKRIAYRSRLFKEK